MKGTTPYHIGRGRLMSSWRLIKVSTLLWTRKEMWGLSLDVSWRCLGWEASWILCMGRIASWRQYMGWVTAWVRCMGWIVRWSLIASWGFSLAVGWRLRVITWCWRGRWSTPHLIWVLLHFRFSGIKFKYTSRHFMTPNSVYWLTNSLMYSPE